MTAWLEYYCDRPGCNYSTVPQQTMTPYLVCPRCGGPWRARPSDGYRTPTLTGERHDRRKPDPQTPAPQPDISQLW